MTQFPPAEWWLFENWLLVWSVVDPLLLWLLIRKSRFLLEWSQKQVNLHL